jgi:hypothetical protein
VEVDPAQVNLSAIETFFQEKRPSFAQGAEVFQFGAGGGNNVFYSRRIGRAPQLGVGGAADMPDAARILGAGKLSGRTAGGWAIGVLEALTGSAEARVRDPGGSDHTLVVEPLTNFFVARARREGQAGRAVFGGMLTAVNRSLDSQPLRAQLPSAAYSGGFDFTRENIAPTWVLSGFFSGSHAPGAAAAAAGAPLARAGWSARSPPATTSMTSVSSTGPTASTCRRA